VRKTELISNAYTPVSNVNATFGAKYTTHFEVNPVPDRDWYQGYVGIKREKNRTNL